MRLIDADELEKQFGLYCLGECEACKHYEYVDYRTGGCCCTLIKNAPTVKPETEPVEFRKLMDEIAAHVQKEPTDADETHWAADNLMCEILEQFGYGEGIAVFKEMPKWYS